METESPELQKKKYAEFISLLPLTAAIAGLPHADVGQYFNEGQMENRANALRTAYKVARELIRDIVQ